MLCFIQHFKGLFLYSRVPGNERIRKTNETGTLPQRPGIYRLAANDIMDCEQQNDYAGDKKAINPRALEPGPEI